MKEYNIFEDVDIMKNTVLYGKKDISEETMNEALKANELRPLYSDDFVAFLKKLIVENDLFYEDILDKLPNANYIRLDENRVKSIKKFFGVDIHGLPVSYMMVESVIKNGNLKYFDDQMYYNTSEDPVRVPFTKDEFIDSILYFKEKTPKHIELNKLSK